jgi:hypothetical protein
MYEYHGAIGIIDSTRHIQLPQRYGINHISIIRWYFSIVDTIMTRIENLLNYPGDELYAMIQLTLLTRVASPVLSSIPLANLSLKYVIDVSVQIQK